MVLSKSGGASKSGTKSDEAEDAGVNFENRYHTHIMMGCAVKICKSRKKE